MLNWFQGLPIWSPKKLLANNNNISTTMTGKKVAVCARAKLTDCPSIFNWNSHSTKWKWLDFRYDKRITSWSKSLFRNLDLGHSLLLWHTSLKMKWQVIKIISTLPRMLKLKKWTRHYWSFVVPGKMLETYCKALPNLT